MHEIEVWSTHGVVFSFRIARTHLRAIWRSNFDAYGDLVESKWQKPKFRFSIARALPRAHYGARSWSPLDEEFYFLHFINLYQVDWTNSFRCRSVFHKKTPNGLAWKVVKLQEGSRAFREVFWAKFDHDLRQMMNLILTEISEPPQIREFPSMILNEVFVRDFQQ